MDKNNREWKNLSLEEKAKLMSVYVQHGYNNVSDIQKDYDANYAHYIEANPDFMQRLRDNDTTSVANSDGSRSTHKLGYVTNDNGAVLYPAVQREKDGTLKDHTGESLNGYRSAEEKGDTINVSTPSAIWLSENYKKDFPKYFEKFINKFEEGGPENKEEDGEEYNLGNLDAAYVSTKLSRNDWNKLYANGKVSLNEVPKQYRSWIEGENSELKHRVTNAIDNTGKQIFNAIDTATAFMPGPVGTINWLAHTGVDAATGQYGKIATDLALAAGLYAGGKVLSGALEQIAPRVKSAVGHKLGMIDDINQYINEGNEFRIVGEPAIRDAKNSGLIRAKQGWHHDSAEAVAKAYPEYLKDIPDWQYKTSGEVFDILSSRGAFDNLSEKEKFLASMDFRDSSNHGGVVHYFNGMTYPNYHVNKNDFVIMTPHQNRFVPGHGGVKYDRPFKENVAGATLLTNPDGSVRNASISTKGSSFWEFSPFWDMWVKHKFAEGGSLLAQNTPEEQPTAPYEWTDKDTRDYIQAFESFSDKAYDDGKGNITAGWGHKLSDAELKKYWNSETGEPIGKIPKEITDRWWAEDFSDAAYTVDEVYADEDLPSWMIAALTSMAFNGGKGFIAGYKGDDGVVRGFPKMEAAIRAYSKNKTKENLAAIIAQMQYKDDNLPNLGGLSNRYGLTRAVMEGIIDPTKVKEYINSKKYSLYGSDKKTKKK